MKNSQRILPADQVEIRDTPSDDHLVLIERVNTTSGSYEKINHGSPHPDAINHPLLVLAKEDETPDNPEVAVRVWVSLRDKSSQEFYNWTLQYRGEHPNAKVYAREYTVPREDYTKDALLTTVTGAKLIKEEVVRETEEKDGWFVKVRQIYEMFPSRAEQDTYNIVDKQHPYNNNESYPRLVRRYRFASDDLIYGDSITFTWDTILAGFATAHGLSDDDRVRVSSTGTLPTGLSAGQDYYVIDSSANAFSLSETLGGAFVATTDNGTGTLTVQTVANNFTHADWSSDTEYAGSTLIQWKIVDESTDVVVVDAVYEKIPPALAEGGGFDQTGMGYSVEYPYCKNTLYPRIQWRTTWDRDDYEAGTITSCPIEPWHTAPYTGMQLVSELMEGSEEAEKVTVVKIYERVPGLVVEGEALSNTGAKATSQTQVVAKGTDPEACGLLQVSSQVNPKAGFDYSIKQDVAVDENPTKDDSVIDPETRLPVTVVSEIVTKDEGNVASQAGGVETVYRDINKCKQLEVTSTLETGVEPEDEDQTFGERTEYVPINFSYPTVLLGFSTASLRSPSNDRVLTKVRALRRRGFTEKVTATVTTKYAFSPDDFTEPTIFRWQTQDLIFNGMFFTIREFSVINDDIDPITFTTGTDNRYYGYAGESYDPSATTPVNTTQYAAAVSDPAGKDVWSSITSLPKYGLWRQQVYNVPIL